MVPVLNGKNIKAGVPLWSILDPLLFIIFINDIVNGNNYSIKLFTEVTSLYLIVDDPINTAESLNS